MISRNAQPHIATNRRCQSEAGKLSVSDFEPSRQHSVYLANETHGQKVVWSTVLQYPWRYFPTFSLRFYHKRHMQWYQYSNVEPKDRYA
jgi:hypothetical protein